MVIKFCESTSLPHMAWDKKHYLRAGAHCVPANHFFLEALRSLRNYSKPNLKGLVKAHTSKPNIGELVIASINDAVALDVVITFDPLPRALAEHYADRFLLKVALIDKLNPFRMDLYIFGSRDETFGASPLELQLSYKDSLGNEYNTEQTIAPLTDFIPWKIGEDTLVKLTNAITLLAGKIALIDTSSEKTSMEE